ncbi:MAG: 50S ribosomal protein L4 [Parcubacteria group bacterium]|nr:50S ribosomal protein L4 [Parcubacteria group bacterium]
MESVIYNQSGQKTGSIKLPEKVFGLPFNSDMVHEVVVSMQSNARFGTADTKDRSAVRGGGKKPWQQKGTGRARHGSRRSPIWRGGGITFGPTTEKKYERKINKKVRVKALFMLISKKLHDGELLFVDRIVLAEAKTKNAKEILENLSTVSGFSGLKTKKKNSACIYISEKDKKTERSFNNFGNILVAPVTSMNPLDVAKYKYVVITDPEKSVAFLVKKIKNAKN